MVNIECLERSVIAAYLAFSAKMSYGEFLNLFPTLCNRLHDVLCAIGIGSFIHTRIEYETNCVHSPLLYH